MAGGAGKKGRCPLLMTSLTERHGRAGLHRQHRRVGEAAVAFDAMQSLGCVDCMVGVMYCSGARFLRQLCLLVALEAIFVRNLGQKDRPADAPSQEGIEVSAAGKVGLYLSHESRFGVTGEAGGEIGVV